MFFYVPVFDKAVARNVALHGKKFDLPLVSETTSSLILLLTDLLHCTVILSCVKHSGMGVSVLQQNVFSGDLRCLMQQL